MTNQLLVQALACMSGFTGILAMKGMGGKTIKPCQIGREWNDAEIVNWRFPPGGKLKSAACLACAVDNLTATEDWPAAYNAFTTCGANWSKYDPPEDKAPPAGIVPPQNPTICNDFPNAENPSPIDWQKADETCLSCAVATLQAGTANALMMGTAACTPGDDECTYQQARGAFAACGSPAELWAEDVLPELNFPLP